MGTFKLAKVEALEDYLEKDENLADLPNKATARANLQLGTAAQSNVTTSRTDTTSGRLLKVGDFGVGGLPPNVTDNTVAPGNASGFFANTQGSTPGAPTTNRQAGVTISGVSGHGVQLTSDLILSDNFVNGALYYRNFRASATPPVGPWRELYHTGNLLGTVSKTGDYAKNNDGHITGMGNLQVTGSVIERGSNANGEYIRFADGTQICTREFTVETAILNSTLGGFRTGNHQCSYAATFASFPAVSTTGFASQTITATVSPFGAGTDAVNLQLYAVTSQSDVVERTVYVTAIGRWF